MAKGLAIGRLPSGLPPMPSVSIGSVVVGLHDLTEQGRTLSSITRRIGQRLTYWLRTTAVEKPLPPPEWVEVFRYYQAALLGLLKEQRERAKLQGDAPTEEQLQAQFADELRRALETFNPDERAFAMRLWQGELASTTETPQ